MIEVCFIHNCPSLCMTYCNFHFLHVYLYKHQSLIFRLPAPEQHARRDHLDDHWTEAQGLLPHPGQRAALLGQGQRPRAQLWEADDHPAQVPQCEEQGQEAGHPGTAEGEAVPGDGEGGERVAQDAD